MRPLSVTILACIYLAVGSLGFAAHWGGVHAANALRFDGVWIEAVEVVAIVSGAWMLRGRNWARWLAIAWMALHVVWSALGAVREFAVHSLFCAAIVWLLFRPAANRYFKPDRLWPITPRASPPG